ncbi:MULTISPECIES: hypothetical protein [unclassified Amycolatopsis]|uniref:hypothetical protein n=1 Tax=unclassified Amycolatopsis TaxID=2618356 RepID=UPI002876D933|nr:MULTISPECIES: hypothetical protein [unclassified Amycolatopsis]MDS0139264.1 hypothetical protein [Amycolatopsis sp. 505]MDS0144496.1 hypothetical protein [Amycolatopsis sp. CM201R]
MSGDTGYDVGSDGSRCAWARVLVCAPPERVVLSWDISPRWSLDRHGEGWESVAGLGAGSGWPRYLDRFRAAAHRDAARN